MKILVTGSAGFVGYHLVNRLLEDDNEVVGLDNINDYYDPQLKFDRLSNAGISQESISWNLLISSTKYGERYRFIRMNLEDKESLMELCKEEGFEIVINLAAQAGVRYSIQNPDAYIQSNVVGFLNILECCRHFPVRHFVYASSSSVYGLNQTMPFSVKHNVDHPISLYAATKKSNELMAHTYSHLYGISTSALRFFTVYGPWGRPDMAYFMFTKAIAAGESIRVFNHGRMKRDFTYIDDIVSGIINIMNSPAKPNPQWNGITPDPSSSAAPYKVYNIGNNNPVELMSFINEIENNVGKKAVINYEEMQDGDVPATWADVDELIHNFSYKPDTSIKQGLMEFVKWYKEYYKILD